MKLRYFTQCSLCRIGWKMIPNYWCDPRTYYLVSLWASLIAYRIFSNKRLWHLYIGHLDLVLGHLYALLTFLSIYMYFYTLNCFLVFLGIYLYFCAITLFSTWSCIFLSFYHFSTSHLTNTYYINFGIVEYCVKSME